MKYVIRNGKYYLSNHYEKAAEWVLGYGGVYTPKLEEAKLFDTRVEAELECKRARKVNGYVYVQKIN